MIRIDIICSHVQKYAIFSTSSYIYLVKLFNFYWKIYVSIVSQLPALGSMCWSLMPDGARRLQIAFLRLLCQMVFIWKEHIIEKEQTIEAKKMDNLKD